MTEYRVYKDDGGFEQYSTVEECNGQPYEVIDLTPSPEQIQSEAINNEMALQEKRKADGEASFINISAAQRLRVQSGEITEEKYFEMEQELEPARIELVLGQFIHCKKKLELVNQEILGEAFYNELVNRVNVYIAANY